MSAPAPAKAEGGLPPWTLGLPRDESEIEATQRTRKRLAVERALRSKLLAPRVAGIRLDRLDDPDEWGKIPVLTKDELRKLPTAAFYADFCIAPIGASREFWRSGGATGKPLFYPRSAEDLRLQRSASRSGASGRASARVPATSCTSPSRSASIRSGSSRRARRRWKVSRRSGPAPARPRRRRSSSSSSGARADDPRGDAELRAASRQRRGGARHRPRVEFGAQAAGERGAADRGETDEARARVGREGLQQLRHDRRGDDLRSSATASTAWWRGPISSISR